MDREIKVSVITVCLNSEKTIEKTIKSVLDQTYDNYEYIVIDGASTDGTLDILKRYAVLSDGRMKYVSEKDEGIYFAMNKGISMATGDMIGIINSDDWYETDAFQIMVEEYKMSNEKYAVFHGTTDSYRNGELQITGRLDPVNLKTKGMASHPSCFVTKMLYDKYGAFDTKYRYVADYDLMLRLSEKDDVKFIDTGKHIANAELGGLSSTYKASEDLLQLKVNYGLMSKKEMYTLIFKAKVSSLLAKVMGKR